MPKSSKSTIDNFFIRYTYVFPIVLWSSIVLILSFSTVTYIWILYPFLITLLVWPYKKIIGQWIYSERNIIACQLGIAIFFFLYHRFDILQLELWSDELFSIKIASHSFDQIAKVALTLSDIPPLHYWDLWFWLKIIQNTPVQFSEFIYRLPTMGYHTISAIIFASYIASKVRTTRLYYHIIVQLLSFLSFFFNPLLFPFALEVRPYALMVLGGVISMIALDTGEYMSARFIPVQLTLFLLSFFNILYFIPICISLWVNKRIRIIGITLGVILLLYLSYLPYIRMPSQTELPIIQHAILRSVQHIQAIFISNYIQLFIMVGIILFLIYHRLYFIFLFQAIILWILAISIGYAIRYQAFSPRHLILSFPIIIYFLIMPSVRVKFKLSVLWILLIAMFYTTPWIKETEHMLRNQLFAPKISIGIKAAIEKALVQNKQIVLEKSSLKIGDSLYFTHKYMEEISLWYIRHYTKTDPKFFLASTECNHISDPHEYVIGLSTPACTTFNDSFSLLQLKILE